MLPVTAQVMMNLRLAMNVTIRRPGDDSQNRRTAFRRHRLATESRIDQHLESAVDQPFAVEGHRILVRLKSRIGHHLLHGLVAHLLRRPRDPREDDGLVVLALHRHWKRRDLALRHVVAPALDQSQRAMLLEHCGDRFGMLPVALAIGGGYGNNESVDVVHNRSPFSVRKGTSWPCPPAFLRASNRACASPPTSDGRTGLRPGHSDRPRTCPRPAW